MNRYVTILEFMITDLQLRGVELILYAIIYGYSQGSYGEYWGGMDDMMYWSQASRRGVQKALEKLIEKGLIKKSIEKEGRTRRAVFSLNDGANLVRPESADRANSVPPQSELSSITERTEFAHSDYIKRDIEIDNKSISAELLSEEFEIVWKSYPRKTDKLRAFEEFKKSRKRGASLEKIHAGVKAYAALCLAEKRHTKYIKGGGVFFKGENWNDEVVTDSAPKEKYGETGVAEW